MKTKIIRVSQVMGTILPAPENNTFEKAQRIVTRWLSKKIATNAEPESAESHFVYDDKRGQNAEHLTFEVKDGQKVWAMTYSHPCNDIPGRRWVTEAAIAIKPDNSLFFGLRLNVHDSRQEPIGTITHSMPNLLKDLAGELKLIADGRSVIMDAEEITEQTNENPDLVDSLVENIYNPNRRLAVIVISKLKNGNELVNSNILAKQLAGVAHVYTVDFDSSFILTNRIGRNLGTYNGAVRIYPPVDSNNEVTPRYLFTPQDIASKPPFIIQKTLSNFSFHTSLLNDRTENVYPAFSTIKNFYFENISKNLESVPPEEKNSDLNEKIIEAQAQQIMALRNDVDEALSLASDSEAKWKESEDKLNIITKALEEAQEKLKNLPRPALLTKDALFPGLSRLTEWADDLFRDELAITKRAQRSALSSVYAEPELIYRGLIYLAKEYRNAVLNASSDKGTGRKNLLRLSEQRLQQLHLEDRISISKEFAAHYGDDYYASHNGHKYFLDRHLTKGGTRDPKRCLRIYYAFDDKEEKVIVGHLPTHLKNRLT